MLLKVDTRQRDTILAALRLWQQHTIGPNHELYEIAADDGPPLTGDEIDELCEGINVGELVFHTPMVAVVGDRVFGPYDEGHVSECKLKPNQPFWIAQLEENGDYVS